MFVAGADVGTECVKAMVANGDGKIVGRATVPTRGYFQDCFQDAIGNALQEAQAKAIDLQSVVVTGFGASCAPLATRTMTETLCHARGAFHQLQRPMTLVDIGGRDHKVVRVDERGAHLSSEGFAALIGKARGVDRADLGTGPRHCNAQAKRTFPLCAFWLS